MHARVEDNHPEKPDAGDVVRCIGCGYRLTGLPVEARCPECATPIGLSLGPGPPRIREPTEPSVVSPDANCVRCGQRLGPRGTSDSCPACRVPVWLSRYGDWLCVRHPRWLRRVHAGLGIWVWVLIIPVVLNVVAFVTPFVFAYLWNVLFWDEAATTLLHARAIVSSAVSFLRQILELVAVVLITAPNPAATEIRLSLRRLLRIAIAAYVVTWIMATLVEMLAEPGPALSLAVWMPVTLVLTFVGLGLIEYMRRLIRRLPNRRLERSATILLWGFVLLKTCTLIESFIRWGLSEEAIEEVWSAGFFGRSGGVLVLMVATTVLFITLSIWLVVVVVRFRRALPKATGVRRRVA